MTEDEKMYAFHTKQWKDLMAEVIDCAVTDEIGAIFSSIAPMRVKLNDQGLFEYEEVDRELMIVGPRDD